MSSDRSWKTPRAVAVESCGFIASTPVWRRKGAVYILLTAERVQFIERFFPQVCRWYVDGRDRREVSGYTPHKWLGYSETPFDAGRDAGPISTTRGELIVDAGALLTLMERVETRFLCDVVNGTRITIALLQAALGREPTGRAVLAAVCEPCEGHGSTGDYSRGTGRMCRQCDGSGEVRVQPPTG